MAPKTIVQHYEEAAVSVRERETSGGGTMILISRDVAQYRWRRREFSEAIKVDFEYTCVEIDGSVCILNVYANQHSRLAGLIQGCAELARSGAKMVLAGDFNAAHAMWKSTADKTVDDAKKNHRGNVLQALMRQCGITLVNNPSVPTTSHGSSLDLAFADPDLIQGADGEHQVIPMRLTGSHYPCVFGLAFDRECKPIGGSKKNRVLLKLKTSEEEFAQCVDRELSSLSREKHASATQIEEQIRKALHTTAQKHCKKRTAGKSEKKIFQPEWIGEGEDFSAAEHRESLNDRRNKYFRDKIKGIGVTTTSGYMYDICRVGNRKYPAKYYTGTKHPDDAAEELEKKFSYADAEEDPERTRECRKQLNKLCDSEKEPAEFSGPQVHKVIMGLRKDAAGGADGLSNKEIIWAAQSTNFCNAVAQLATVMIRTGKAPRGFYKAVIIPLAKSSGGWRPISLLSAIDKLAQRLIAGRIREEMRGLGDAQHGYRSGFSAELLLDRVVSSCEEAMAKGKQVALMSLDISAAFDRIQASFAAEQMIKVGVSAHVSRFCHSYMQNRRYELRFNLPGGEYGYGDYPQLAGCVQGSVLGPTIFLCCIQELLDNLNRLLGCQALGFADDLTLKAIANTRTEAQRILQLAADEAGDWSASSKWRWSFHKCQVMMMGKDAGGLCVELQGMALENTREMRLLGVTIDADLRFEGHAAEVSRRVADRARTLYFLAAQKWGVQAESAISFYKAVVESVPRYAASTWARRCTKKTRGAIQNQLNTCLRVCMCLPMRTPIGWLHMKAGCLRLDELAYVGGMMNAARRRLLGIMEGGRNPYDAALRILLPDDTYALERFVPSAEPSMCANWSKLSFGSNSILNDDEANAAMTSGSVNVFTDGSVLSGGASGAAFVMVDGDTGEWGESDAIFLEECDHPYEAELAAMQHACEKADEVASVKKATKVNLFTDCKAAVSKMRSRNFERKQEEELAKRVNQLGNTVQKVQIHHIKAHNGCVMNEAADWLARRAANCGQKGGKGTKRKKVLGFAEIKAKVQQEVQNNRRTTMCRNNDDDMLFAKETSRGFRYLKPPGRCRNKAVRRAFDMLQSGAFNENLGEERDSSGAKCCWCEQAVDVGKFGAAAVHCVYDCPALAEERTHLKDNVRDRSLGEVFSDKGVIAIAEGIARKMAEREAKVARKYSSSSSK